MNMNNFNSEEFRNLSAEEKMEFVRSVIQDSKAAGIHAAFLNPATGQTVPLDVIIEEFGEEKAVEIMLEALENFHGEVKTLDMDNITNLLERANRGECTEEELKMLNYVLDKMGAGDSFEFNRNFKNIMWDIIRFAQEDIKYEPQFADVLSALVVSTLASFAYTEGNDLSKYKNEGFMTAIEMVHQLSDDIYETWEKTCETLPSKELIVVALLNLAGKISSTEEFKFAPHTAVSDVLDLELITDDCDCDGECSCHKDENTNGSNEESKMCKPAICQPCQSDEDMRNLLKD